MTTFTSSTLISSTFIVGTGMEPRLRSFVVLILLLGVLLRLVPEASGQAPSPAFDVATVKPAPQLSFSAASVRQSNFEDKATSNVPLTPGDNFKPIQGLFIAKSQPLFVYVLFAYKVQVSEAWDLLSHLPSWAVSDKYDIQARTDEVSTNKDQLREMMRYLLEERFALRTHREVVQRDVLGLEMKGTRFGPQLRRHVDSEPCSGQEVLDVQVVTAMKPEKLLGKWPAICEGDQIGSEQRVIAGARNLDMSAIAAWLTGEGDTDLPIVNKTGFEGKFDLILEFAPEHSPAITDSSLPNFAEALHDQLGLALKKQKGRATVFLVDHIERLKDN